MPDSGTYPEASATVCVRCKRDAADAKGAAYVLERGPYCGRSGNTQPMYACRFGNGAYKEASKDWAPMPVLTVVNGVWTVLDA